MSQHLSPLVSVIIPVYNGAKLIVEAIDSVLKQTYRNIEIIIIDDGSTDTTKLVIESLVTQGKVKYFYQKNKGLPAARNTGISKSSGQYIKFLDCDDLLNPQQIQLQVEHLINKQKTISITDHILRYNDGREIISATNLNAEDQLGRFIRQNFVPVHSVLVERSLLIEAHGFDESLIALEDADLWIRLILLGSHFEKVDYVGCIYRILDSSMSADAKKMFLMKCKIAEKINILLKEERYAISINPSAFDSILSSNTKLIEGCFARRINVTSLLSKTLVVTKDFFNNYSRGIKKIFIALVGVQCFVFIKFKLNCLLKKDYAQKILFDEISWRN